MKKYYKREKYWERIKPFMRSNLIKVIVGQRRVGKSYFLLQLMDTIKENDKDAVIIYINKEDLEFEQIKDYHDLVNYADAMKGDSEYAYLFIDEIQDISQFEKALRHFQTLETWDVYCTGSNADLLSGELATLLSGRYIELTMYSLSYSEFLKFHKLEDSHQSLMQYLKYGGLPNLYHFPLQEDIVFDYLKNIYAAILFKDVVTRHNIRNAAFLDRLTVYIADNIGQLVSAKRISDFLKSQNIKVDHTTLLEYIYHLTTSFFIFKAKRYDLKGKRLLEIGEKYYFGDLGIRNAITDYKPQDIGQLLENAVYQHLLISNYQVNIGKLYDKEIDFVCQKHGETLYIQVTTSLADEKVRKREYGNLLKIKDNYRKIVVTADEYVTENVAGIETINIRKFLKEI